MYIRNLFFSFKKNIQNNSYNDPQSSERFNKWSYFLFKLNFWYNNFLFLKLVNSTNIRLIICFKMVKDISFIRTFRTCRSFQCFVINIRIVYLRSKLAYTYVFFQRLIYVQILIMFRCFQEKKITKLIKQSLSSLQSSFFHIFTTFADSKNNFIF